MFRILIPSLLLIGALYAATRTPESGNTQPAGRQPVASVRQLPLTALTPTPRTSFRPSNRKGYWNIDVVDDFTLPVNKTLIFCGAGRNLHVDKDWSKLFRRGFSAIDMSRMVLGQEYANDPNAIPKGWKSRLKQSQRAQWLTQGYFANDPFRLGWAANSELAEETYYRRPQSDPNWRQSLFQASMELCGSCVGYGDCPPGLMKNTNGFVILDIENEGVSMFKQQEQANLYAYMMKTIKENASPATQIGSIAPVPHNSYGASRASDYRAGLEWLWKKPAQHTRTSRQRGMSDDIIGKSYADYADFQMPGTYYVYPDFDYSIDHSADNGRHWLASLLGEQEVNKVLSPKKRIAWQWLYNTQSSDFPNSGKASNAAPPAIAEGMGVFYWFTGAYGAIFWDDHNALTPDQPTPTEGARIGLGNDRNYACYEHYIHGLWRLFKHHGDLFNGREKYLNQATECSFDGGQTWQTLNANQLKTRKLPYARAIVNGNQILIAATMPYARPDQQTSVWIRYLKDGYSFYTEIKLKGDEIYLGRAAMPTA